MKPLSFTARTTQQLHRLADMARRAGVLALGDVVKVQTTEGEGTIHEGAEGLRIEATKGALAPESSWPVVVISLAKAAARRKSIAPHLRAHGLGFEVFAAINGADCPPNWRHERGAWGCLRSHEAVVQRAMDSGAAAVMVIEDDARLVYDFRAKLAALLLAAPADWDALWLGGTRRQSGRFLKVAPGVVSCAGFYGTTCYLLRHAAMPRVIAAMRRSREAVDNLYSRLAARGVLKVYAPDPDWLAGQVSGYSYIMRRERVGRSPGGAIFLPPETPSGEGVMILSTGTKRRSLALQAASSVRRTMPNLGIQIVSGEDFADFDTRIVKGHDGLASRALKTRLITESPWECGVMLDDDTVTVRPFGLPSAVLGAADIAMAVDPYTPTIGTILRYGVKEGSAAGQKRSWLSPAEAAYVRERFPACESAPHYNSGVVFFRKTEAVIELVRVWVEEWERFRGVDQLALFRAIQRTGIKVKLLPPEMHHRVGHKAGAKNPAIVHFCGKKWESAAWLAKHSIPNVTEPHRACCGGRKPTLRDMAAGVARALGGVLAGAATGQPIHVSAAERTARLSACATCPEKEGGRCKLCGCFVSIKSRLPREACPLALWPDSL